MFRGSLKRLKQSVFWGLCPFFLFRVDAGADPLSLCEAVQRALERSPEVRAGTEGLKGAQARENRMLSLRLPRVDFEESYVHTDQPVSVFGHLLNQGRFTQDLFNDPTLNALNHPDALDGFRTRFSVTQPLFSGGSLTFQHRMARSETRAVGKDLEAARARAVFECVQGYWGLSLALENRDVARAAVDTAEENLRQVEILYREGTVVRSDLLLAKVHVADFKEQLARAEGGVRVASRQLNILVGAPSSGRWAVGELRVPAAEDLPPMPADRLLERAKLLRPEYVALHDRWVGSEQGVKAARGSFLPRMGFQASYEWNAPQFASDLEGSYTLGVGLDWNLFRGFADLALLREAQSRRGMLWYELRRMEDRILLEIEEAVVAVETGRNRLHLTRERVGLSEESLRIIVQRYREGLSTRLEVEQAELALWRSRTAWLGAVHDLRIARVRLRLATGELLGSLEEEPCAIFPGD